MDSIKKHDEPAHPLVRVITFGEFGLERYRPSILAEQTQYVPISWEEWDHRGPALLLLKILLCRANRRASKEELIAAIWPEKKHINTTHALDTAISVLRRHVLHSHTSNNLLETIRGCGETILKLAPQPLLWIDADAFLSLATQAFQLDDQGQDPLPLLEAAYALASHEFLEDDRSCKWAQGRRQTINGARQRVLYKLVDLYVHNKRTSRAEELLFVSLENKPTDEDILCRLMILLSEKERRQEALNVYKYAVEALNTESTTPAPYTKELARRIQQGQSVRERQTNYATTLIKRLQTVQLFTTHFIYCAYCTKNLAQYASISTRLSGSLNN